MSDIFGKNVNMIGLPSNTASLKTIDDFLLAYAVSVPNGYPYLVGQVNSSEGNYRIFGIINGEYEQIVPVNTDADYFFDTMYLNGNFYSRYFGGKLYSSASGGSWSTICTEYVKPVGYQQWTNYPDSPFTKAQYPKQIIYYMGNDEFPADYTYLAVTNNTQDQYGSRSSETELGGGIFAVTTTYMYRLIDGAWVYYATRYTGQYLHLLGPLLPSPITQYIRECNYDVRDYDNPLTVTKAKTTTLEQDNLAGTASSFKNIVNYDGYIYTSASKSGILTLYRYNPSNPSSYWETVASITALYDDSLFALSDGLYTLIDGGWNKFNFITETWDAITDAYCSLYCNLVETDSGLFYLSKTRDDISYLYSIVSGVVSEIATFRLEYGELQAFNNKLYYKTNSLLYEIVGNEIKPIISLDQKDTSSIFTNARLEPCLIHGELGFGASFIDGYSSLFSLTTSSSTSLERVRSLYCKDGASVVRDKGNWWKDNTTNKRINT